MIDAQVRVLLRIYNFCAVFGCPGTLPVIYVICVAYSFTLARFLYVIKTSYPKCGLGFNPALHRRLFTRYVPISSIWYVWP